MLLARPPMHLMLVSAEISEHGGLTFSSWFDLCLLPFWPFFIWMYRKHLTGLCSVKNIQQDKKKVHIIIKQLISIQEFFWYISDIVIYCDVYSYFMLKSRWDEAERDNVNSVFVSLFTSDCMYSWWWDTWPERCWREGRVIPNIPLLYK